MIFQSPHPPIEVPDLPFSAYVLEGAEGREDHPALIDAPTGRTVTYGQLVAGSRAAAYALVERGIGPGDVVAICSPNLPEYAIAFHAVALSGAASTTLNPLQTAEEIAHQLEDSQARLFLTVPPLVDKAREVERRTAVEEIVVFGEAEGVTPFASLIEEGGRAMRKIADEGGDPEERLAGRVEDPADQLVTLPYSSGTTGLPKGVMLTHRNLVANIEQALAVDTVGPGDTVIAVLPFFHIYGMVVIMSACLRAGATVVTLPRFDLETFLETIERHRVNRAYVVPPIVLALAKHPLVDRFDLSSVDRVMSGAAPLGEEVSKACAERLGCRVYQGYGLTEASPVTHMRPPMDRAERIGTVGPGIPGTEVCIVDLESGEMLGAHSEGEVWVRGPQVMKGYLNRPEETAATVDPEGWLHTGDIGWVDEEGYLTVVDRAKELIKYKGYQVAPAELEDLLLSHPRVSDVAVIPSPDEEAGELPKAFVVAAGGLEAGELMDYVAERVAPYKKVRLVEFIDEIPKSPSGKILRRVLVERERAAVG